MFPLKNTGDFTIASSAGGVLKKGLNFMIGVLSFIISDKLILEDMVRFSADEIN